MKSTDNNYTWLDNISEEECPMCLGTGNVAVEFIDYWPRSEVCERCGGLGYIRKKSDL